MIGVTAFGSCTPHTHTLLDNPMLLFFKKFKAPVSPCMDTKIGVPLNIRKIERTISIVYMNLISYVIIFHAYDNALLLASFYKLVYIFTPRRMLCSVT